MDSSDKKVQDQQFKEPHGPTDGGRLQDMAESVKAKFAPHKATPGPAIPQDFNIQQEGTKEERQAKAKELNKDN